MTLRVVFTMHMRLGKGGSVYQYNIVDGEKVIGTMTKARDTGRSPTKFSYDSVGGKHFDTAKGFIAAYKEHKARRAK